MDIAWNGMLTCDYEHSRPHASPLERELYTLSLTTWPAVFLGSPRPYGSARRPGIVDVPESDHHQLVAQLHYRLAEPARARALTEQAAAHRKNAAAALDRAERSLGSDAAIADLAAATAAILIVMSAHIVNWLLPEEHWETRMTKLLGNRLAARACIAALSVPASPGHLLTQLTLAAPPAGLPAGEPGQVRQARAGTADRRDRCQNTPPGCSPLTAPSAPSS